MWTWKYDTIFLLKTENSNRDWTKKGTLGSVPSPPVVLAWAICLHVAMRLHLLQPSVDYFSTSYGVTASIWSAQPCQSFQRFLAWGHHPRAEHLLTGICQEFKVLPTGPLGKFPLHLYLEFGVEQP